MATVDVEIDELYAGPLANFTDARNALAKRAGDRAADVKKLVKPNAAAWAVNQLYWHKRPVFDGLAKASQAKRDAVVRQLGGRGADAATAEARHHAALEKALGITIAILKDAGDAATETTVDAIRRTLDAIPAPEVNGRLTKPLESVGFSMLSSLMTTAGRGRDVRTPGKVVVMTPSRAGAAAERKASDAARRAGEERRRERTKVVRELEAAKTRERDATSAFTKATHAVEQADRRIASLEDQLQDARRAIGDRHQEADRARLAVNDAAAARVHIERRLKELED
jgi:hypothetical protein